MTAPGRAQVTSGGTGIRLLQMPVGLPSTSAPPLGTQQTGRQALLHSSRRSFGVPGGIGNHGLPSPQRALAVSGVGFSPELFTSIGWHVSPRRSQQ